MKIINDIKRALCKLVGYVCPEYKKRKELTDICNQIDKNIKAKKKWMTSRKKNFKRC